MNLRLNLHEERLSRPALFFGVALIGSALGELLYDIIHNMPPPYATFVPIWLVALALAIVLVLVTQLRNPRLRVAALALTVCQGLTLFKLIFGTGLMVWFIDNAFSIFTGMLFVRAGKNENGRIALVVAFLLGVGIVAFRYILLENWVRGLERIGHVF